MKSEIPAGTIFGISFDKDVKERLISEVVPIYFRLQVTQMAAALKAMKPESTELAVLDDIALQVSLVIGDIRSRGLDAVSRDAQLEMRRFASKSK